MTIREAEAWAKKEQASLDTKDSRFGGFVHFVHRDGSLFFYRNAFVLKNGDYIGIFTEHHGARVYPHDEIKRLQSLSSLIINSPAETEK